MAIFLITAPSGAGKTTLAKKVADYGGWVECISTTTRPMRKGEVDGKTYYFTREDFFVDAHQMGEFAEAVTYDGNHYGITHDEIARVKRTNSHIYIIVEHEGYKQIKEQYPDAVGIFLYMTKEECMANMLLRGDSIENATKRIARYEKEIQDRNDYDFVIKNVRDKPQGTANIITGIIRQYPKI